MRGWIWSVYRPAIGSFRQSYHRSSTVLVVVSEHVGRIATKNIRRPEGRKHDPSGLGQLLKSQSFVHSLERDFRIAMHRGGATP